MALKQPPRATVPHGMEPSSLVKIEKEKPFALATQGCADAQAFLGAMHPRRLTPLRSRLRRSRHGLSVGPGDSGPHPPWILQAPSASLWRGRASVHLGGFQTFVMNQTSFSNVISPQTPMCKSRKTQKAAVKVKRRRRAVGG